MHDPITLFYIPVPSREVGMEMARTVVKERLAACGNLLGEMSSIYEWEGKMCEEEEFVLILKTTAEKAESLSERMKELHLYECPCLAHWEVSAHPDFSEWVKGQLT